MWKVQDLIQYKIKEESTSSQESVVYLGGKEDIWGGGVHLPAGSLVAEI